MSEQEELQRLRDENKKLKEEAVHLKFIGWYAYNFVKRISFLPMRQKVALDKIMSELDQYYDPDKKDERHEALQRLKDEETAKEEHWRKAMKVYSIMGLI
ncbi:MAG: hypothetical protein M0P69_07495 [Bacteroidales bacterium]|nr:hypothetical protein [Bacteroidales bacterium]